MVDIAVFERDEHLIADLREAGWRLSRTEAGEARIVCMPHVTRPMLTSFIEDFDRLAR